MRKNIETPILTETDARTRLWGRVTGNVDECWIWPGAKLLGYGVMWIGGRPYYVHRLAVVHMTRQQIPSGLTVDHVAARGCKSRACCNPNHLEIVTRSENTKRYHRLRGSDDPEKWPCGHPRGYFKRHQCRVCHRANRRKKYHALKITKVL